MNGGFGHWENPDADGQASAAEGRIPFQATPYTWVDDALIPPRPWLYGSRLMRGYTAVTVAPGGVGKTALLIGEALSMVTARPLLGRQIDAPLRVWVWNLEDDRDEMTRRVQAACRHYDISSEDLGGRLYLDSGREQGLCTAIATPNGAQILEPVIGNLIEEMRRRQIDILSVDPFISSHRVSENDNAQIDAVMKAWGRVAHEARAAIDLQHHNRKSNGAGEATIEDARGAKALTDAARDVRVLNRMTREEADRAMVKNHRLYFRAYSDKASMSPPADSATWYQLCSVQLTNGDWVGVVDTWTWPDPFEGVSAHHLKQVQEAIAGKGLRIDVRSDQWVGNTIAEVLGLSSSDKAVRARVGSLIKTWIENGALKVIEIEDERRRKRKAIEVGKWVE